MKKIEYRGIKTNNLKNIDISFNENELVLICGDSGSGKSSLAFDTIASISENEFNRLTHDNTANIKYDIEYYSNVIPAVSLKQLNFNINPRSTIMSYFGLHKPLSLILNNLIQISMNDFSSNGTNRCKICNGLGYVRKPSINAIVDFDKKIKDIPFKCWNNSYQDYYKQILFLYCEEMNINLNTSFKDLSKQQQELLLSNTGKIKHKISYKIKGKLRSKTAVYTGPLLEFESSNAFISTPEKYMVNFNCEECNGSRLNHKIASILIKNDITVGTILTCNFDDLYYFLNSLNENKQKNPIKESINYLIRFTRTCKNLDISYLNLSRSIPSLSGGELQRLKIVQLLMGKIDHLLTVIDEPTASLHPMEAKNVIKSIFELSNNNTILLVEHNTELIKKADKTFYLGPCGGKKGGYLISKEQYLETQKYNLDYQQTILKEFFKIHLESSHVNYNSDIQFALNALNGICGQSGIGKTTILKDILPTVVDNYKYISQKPIMGSSNATVASYTGIFDIIRNVYSKVTKKSKSLFSNHSDGACPKCSGSGKILIGNFYDEKYYETCNKCLGTGYSSKALKERVNGYNIAEILNLEVSELINLKLQSKKLDKIISILNKLDLGHIKLNQKIYTLSGGENQRIKLCMALIDNKSKVIGLDEPSKGLSEKAIKKLINILYKDIENTKKTYIIAEHNPLFLSNCTFLNELNKINNEIIVCCSGTPTDIKQSEKSIIKQWLI